MIKKGVVMFLLASLCLGMVACKQKANADDDTKRFTEFVAKRSEAVEKREPVVRIKLTKRQKKSLKRLEKTYKRFKNNR